MGGDTSDVWVVVPMYNESSTVASVVADLKTSFDNVVCIDDGSSDDSASLAVAAGAVVVRHPLNLGQGAALQTGFDYALSHAGTHWVITFDADGQHLVSDAVAMLATGRERSLDVVLASRFLGRSEEMPPSRRMLLRAAVAFSRRTSGLDLSDTHNGLRVISREALSSIRLRQPRMAYASELEAAINAAGLSYSEVPTTVLYSEYSRAKGQKNSNAINIVFDLALARLRALA